MSTITKGIKQFFTVVPERDNQISNRRALLGAFAVIATQLTDFLTTTVGLSKGAAEQNSLMLNLITSTGTLGFLAVKLVAGLFLAWYSYKRRFAPWIIAGIYTGVTLWNLLIITAL
jgi:hypothetical protein